MNHHFGSLTDGVLQMERILPANINHVWRYLVEPEKRSQWLADGTMTDTTGQTFNLHFDHTQLSDEATPQAFSSCDNVSETARLVRIAPPKHLIIIWNEGGPAESEVSFELIALSNSTTRLTLIHRRLPDRKQILNHASGWHAHLNILDDLLNERTPRPYWTDFMCLEAAYQKRIPS